MTSPIPSFAPGDEGSSRRRQIMEIAARLFARKGYRGASMRDIGEQAGVLGGSLYHHIKSKDALFIELHNAALDVADLRIAQAIEGARDPWEKLERACATLLEIQIAPDSLTMTTLNYFREVSEGVRHVLIAKRGAYANNLQSLFTDLPRPSRTKPTPRL